MMFYTSATWHSPFFPSGWSSILSFYQALVYSLRCNFSKTLLTLVSLDFLETNWESKQKNQHKQKPNITFITDKVNGKKQLNDKTKGACYFLFLSSLIFETTCPRASCNYEEIIALCWSRVEEGERDKSPCLWFLID